MESYDRRRRTALLTCGIAVLGAICGTLSCQEKKPEPSSKSSIDPRAILKIREMSGQEPNFQIRVSTGSPEDAATYAQVIKDNLGIELNANLDDVLKLCGYGALTGRDVEITPPDQLMARFPGDIVASRFFAPKIIDVSDFGAPANTKQLGWRKVVRFRVKGPLATDKGITSMFLLFNVFQDRADVANDPFLPCIQDTARCSINNQVMLIVGNPRPETDNAYWLVFKNAADNGGERTDNLPATFDGGGEYPVGATDAVRPYYLPAACAECHGNNRINAKLNYLDSDHWNDRIQDGDDFSLLRTQSRHGVLFDGGRDTASTTFKNAFSAVKTLNTEIRDQNRAAGGDDFQIRAVENWLRIHATNTNFMPPIDRAIPAPPSNPNARVWSRQNQNDEALLKLLNQFCFRCHSSVRYNVFDKEAVFQRKGLIQYYVNPPPQSPNDAAGSQNGHRNFKAKEGRFAQVCECPSMRLSPIV